MAGLKQAHIKLLVLFCLSFFSFSTFAAISPPKTHFLSSELMYRPERYRLKSSKKQSLRRFKIKKDNVLRLKKSSFWNRRSYQFSTPFIAEEMLFVGVDAGRFYGIDLNKRKKMWEFMTEGPVQTKAAFADGIVYFGDAKSYVYAIESKTGVQKWRAHLDTEILAAPLLVSNRVYIVDMSGRLYALDAATGVEFWHTPPNDKGVGFSIRRASSPVFASGLIIVGNSNGTLMAYNESDGQIAWVKQLGDRQTQFYDVDSTALVEAGNLYVASADGSLFCVQTTSGKVTWQVPVGGANDVLLNEGKLYVSGEGILSSLNPEDGSIFWQQDFDTPDISSPAGGKDFVAVVSTVDKLYFIDDENGDVIFGRYVRGGSFGNPVIVDNFLHVLANNGRLYSFKFKELPPRKQHEAKKTATLKKNKKSKLRF